MIASKFLLPGLTIALLLSAASTNASSMGMGYGGMGMGQGGTSTGNNNTYGAHYQGHYQGQQGTGIQAGGGHMGFGGSWGQGNGLQYMQHYYGSSARGPRIFSQLDANLDGNITLDEFLVRPVENATYRFVRIDTDNNGAISADEFLYAHNDSYNMPNNAPEIDLDALHACIHDQWGDDIMYQPNNPPTFEEVDTNGDGGINFEEFTAFVTDTATVRFELIDQDNSGAITNIEMDDRMGEMGTHHAIRQDCIDEQRDMNELFEG